jgi:hypothetical protein
MNEWNFFVCVKWMNKGFCERMKEGFVCVKGWMKVLYVWKDEWRFCMCERMKEGFECVNGWRKVLNVWKDEGRFWMCEWMNEGFVCVMDEWKLWMCEWMNEGFVCVMDEWKFWMCEWMNEGFVCVMDEWKFWMCVNEGRLICMREGWMKVNLYVWMDEWRRLEIMKRNLSPASLYGSSGSGPWPTLKFAQQSHECQ